MTVASGLSRLDGMADRFPNFVREVDLSQYMEDEVRHLVKPASAYAEEVARNIFTPPEETGIPLPFNQGRSSFFFRPHEMTVWVGYKGHGKSSLVSQVFNHFMHRGQKCFVISPEFRPARVIERMVYQYHSSRALTQASLDKWFEWATKYLWLYDAQAALKPDHVVALCRYAFDKFRVNHILIDSLMKCGMDPDDYGAQKRFVDHIQSVSHTFGPHIHLIAHARKGVSDATPPRLHDIKGTSEIADLVENVIAVWRNKDKEKVGSGKDKEPDASCIVEAQRNGTGWIGAAALSYDPLSMLFGDFGAESVSRKGMAAGESCPI